MLKFESRQRRVSKIGTDEMELKYVLNLEVAGTLSEKDVIEFACKHTGMQSTMVKAALDSCFQIIEYHLALGYRVKMGELGTFYPTIKTKSVYSNEDAGLAQLEKVNVRFRPNQELLEKINKSEKELTGIYKLVDEENKFYDEVGTKKLDGSGDGDGGDGGGGTSGGGNNDDNQGGGGGGTSGGGDLEG